MQLLLIDDNANLCKLYQELLRQGGHEVRFETNAENALDAIRMKPPELILLDIMMEPISGWEVLEQIRSSTDIADIPVIILTGKVLTAHEARKYGLMIEGFIMKPLERTMLLKAVDDIKEVIDESEEQYLRAISSGLTSEQASACRDGIKKKNILKFLHETLLKQEQLMKEDVSEHVEILNSLDELRQMITTKYQELRHLMKNCP
ncbi:MAG TPA: response regulator [Methanospirillum sp.]|mgnify:CR=1 FL=1|jgi:CheY-like chemotaxis protein|uniref:response regulator n=1 Tax=Methanospirillum sp. TaxID=45200 RepID=UPI001BD5FC5D|nr:response regulator [Methanospirillum sp.]HPY61120.1 response regulator [Methanospirillum sp.]